jgi:alpha-aminoadipic semialdehyde synthase
VPGAIGIRSETKSPWERRTPVTPDLARNLVDEGVRVLVQPSARRVFSDREFLRAGAELTTDLFDANAVLGVKEIPLDALLAGKTYLFFSHVIKGQPHNMPMLARMMELGCTLIDYEMITDDAGRRLVFFGRFAGLAGMIDTLSALGERLLAEGVRTPFRSIQPAHTYDTLEDAKNAIREAGQAISSDGLPPLASPMVIGIAGYGNVARGVREILSEIPIREIQPQDLLAINSETFAHRIGVVTFKEQDIVAPNRSDQSFELQDYYDHPERYHAAFADYLPQLTVLMNCNYWDERYPRLVGKQDLRRLYDTGQRPKLQVIGDLSCDVEGAVECTLKVTEPGDPVYVWDPDTGTISSGVEGRGPVVLAVDILPSELPREASAEFSSSLVGLLPALARADFGADFGDLRLPPALLRAIIVHRGELTPAYRYLDRYFTG